MAEKSVKKPVAKKAPAKKTVSKAAPAKKPVAKKAPVKKVAAPKNVAPVVEMPAPMVTPCPCGHDCKCKCHGGCKFCRFVKKLFVVLVIFALGFATAKICCGKRPMPKPEFRNGCLVMETVKCQKMRDLLPAMDVNGDDCISMEEYKALKKQLRQEKRGNKHHEPEMAPAPEMAE